MYSLSGTILSRWEPAITHIVIDYLPMEDLLDKSEQEIEKHTWKEIQEIFRHIFYPKSTFTIDHLLEKRMKTQDVRFREKAREQLDKVLKEGTLDSIKIKKLYKLMTSPVPSHLPILSLWNSIGIEDPEHNPKVMISKSSAPSAHSYLSIPLVKRTKGIGNPVENWKLIFTKKALSNLSIQTDKLKALCAPFAKYTSESEVETMPAIIGGINIEREQSLLTLQQTQGVSKRRIGQLKKELSLKISLKDRTFQRLTLWLFNFIKGLTEEDFEAIKEEIIKEKNPNLNEILDLMTAVKLAKEAKEQLDFDDLNDKKNKIILERIFAINSLLFIEFVVMEIDPVRYQEDYDDFNDCWEFLGFCFEHPACPPECRGRILEHIVSRSDRGDSEKADAFFSSKLQPKSMSITRSLTAVKNPLMRITRNLIGRKNPLMRSTRNLIGRKNPLMRSTRNLIGRKNPLMRFTRNLIGRKKPLMRITKGITGEIKPLHLAAFLDLGNTTKEILKRESEDINFQDKDGNTALHVAAISFAYEAMDQLIDHRADVNIRNKMGSTPLIELLNDDSERVKLPKTLNGVPRLVEKLLTNGAKPNDALSDKKTALHFAVSWEIGHEVIPILLKWGANPNLLDVSGGSPLIYAITEMDNIKDEKSVMALLDSEKTDVNIGKDEVGNTPLHLAVSHSIGSELDDFDRVIDDLLLLGANIYAENNLKETPLDLAVGEELQKRLVEGYKESLEISNGGSEDIPSGKVKSKKRKKSTHSVKKKKPKSHVSSH